MTSFNVDEEPANNAPYFRKIFSLEGMAIIMMQIVACVVWGVHVDSYNAQQDIRIQQNKENIVAVQQDVRQIAQNNAATSEHLARLDEQLTSINGKVTDIHDQIFSVPGQPKHGTHY